jgi:hypothetical protein
MCVFVCVCVCVYIQAMPDTGTGRLVIIARQRPGLSVLPPRAHQYGTEVDGPAIGPHAAPSLALARHTYTKSATQVIESFVFSPRDLPSEPPHLWVSMHDMRASKHTHGALPREGTRAA